eukprot:Clim_evm33s153 gene=Clim_evmTU33s153
MAKITELAEDETTGLRKRQVRPEGVPDNVEVYEVEQSDDSKPDFGVLAISVFTASILSTLVLCLVSFAVTRGESIVFEKEWLIRKLVWGTLHDYVTGDHVFTAEELKGYDGSDPSKPLYLAFDGVVYDVTAGTKHYGPEGGYNFFAGRDATRSYVTGDFENDLHHDVTGLTEKQLKGLEAWRTLYSNSNIYFRIGIMDHAVAEEEKKAP